jgi:hypothetical protein
VLSGDAEGAAVDFSIAKEGQADGRPLAAFRTRLQVDLYTGLTRTLYFLRHMAICVRKINCHGRVCIFNLAKNAGTSVDRIERFCAKYLPLSKVMAKKLESFEE